ncbi:type II toxin-antitoxin system HicB family antitoxin [Thermodesulfobacteriota bacterium]
MNYKLPVIITQLEEGVYMARCEEIRATATGDTPDEAVQNLREAIKEMVKEYGENAVFQGVIPESEVQVIEVAI